MDLEEPGALRGRLSARGDGLADLLSLLGCELGAATADPAFLPSLVQPGFGPFPDHGAFELGERPDQLHHHPAGGRGGIDRLGQTPEPGAFPLDQLHEVQEVLEAAAQAVKFPDDQDIPGSQLVEHPMQLGPVPAPSGSVLGKDPFGTRLLEGPELQGGVLILLFGNAGIADEHGRCLHKGIARPREGFQVSGGWSSNRRLNCARPARLKA